MTGPARYTVFGVDVAAPVADALAAAVYEAAGVVSLEGYFDPIAGSVPAGDPGAEATDVILEDVVGEFATLYDVAEFDAASQVNPGEFEFVYIAGNPNRVAAARELFDAAATIQRADLRTVQTAILAAHLDVDAAPTSG